MHISVVSYPASRHDMSRATPPSTIKPINPSLQTHAFVIVNVQCTYNTKACKLERQNNTPHYGTTKFPSRRAPPNSSRSRESSQREKRVCLSGRNSRNYLGYSRKTILTTDSGSRRNHLSHTALDSRRFDLLPRRPNSLHARIAHCVCRLDSRNHILVQRPHALHRLRPCRAYA